MRYLLIPLIVGLMLQAAQAEEDEGHFLIGKDAFHAGRTITHNADGADDLFIAGQRLSVVAPVTGSVHAAGQSVNVQSAVGGDVYALGQDIRLSDDVAGDVALMGQNLTVDGAIGEDLRAAGERIELNAPVAGYALLAGRKIELNSEIGGDVSLAADTVVFGEGARIDGRLDLYEEKTGEIDVPASVAPESRVSRHEIDKSGPVDWKSPLPQRRQVVGSFIGGVIAVALLAALIAAIAPQRLAQMRREVLAAPFRTLGIGFLTESALIGSIFLVAITLIGLLLVPAILLLAGVVSLAGYVIAAYAFGVGLILLIGRQEPDSLAERAVAAGIGALVAAVLGLIPVLGWIFVLALCLTGVGAIVRMLFGTPSATEPAAL